MPNRFESRIAKLERFFKPKQSTNHVLRYSPNTVGSWEAAKQNATPPFMVVVDFGTDDEWEAALAQQQHQICTVSSL